MAGESCEDIQGEIEKAIPQCQEKECSCSEIFQYIAGALVAVAAVAAVVATRGRASRLAAAETRALIERLQALNKVYKFPKGTITPLVAALVFLEARTAEWDALLNGDVQKALDNLEKAKEAASRTKPLTIEIIGGQEDGK